jgi:hypothetical protein
MLPVPKILLGVLLLSLAFTSTSCIVTYHGFPPVEPDLKPIHSQNQNLSYLVEPSMSEGERASERLLRTVYLPGWITDYDDVRWCKTCNTVQVNKSLSADRSLADLFERAFPEAVASQTASGKHLHVRMSVNYSPADPYEASYISLVQVFLSAMTLSVIPVATAKEYSVSYALHVDGELYPRQLYIHRFRKRTFGGILVLPFVWMNAFTYDEKEALRATLYQFLLDAERDGYLKH